MKPDPKTWLSEPRRQHLDWVREREPVATFNGDDGGPFMFDVRRLVKDGDLSKVRTVAGDYHEGQLADVMSQPVLVGDVVETWLRRAEDRPTLVFAVDRAHARKLSDAFERAGVPCGYVDANTDRDERKRIGHGDYETLEKLRAGDRTDPMVRRYFELLGLPA